MKNPWLTIPLEDYESHMTLPDVGQAKMLANEFKELLNAYVPTSVAVVGCAGGNGFEEAAEAGVTRIIGVDINPIYIEHAKTRYAGRIDGLELYCANIEETLPISLPVQMVYAALVFEYVDLTEALKNLRGLCTPNGLLVGLLQLPKEGAANVSPSAFTSLKALSSIMRLVAPEQFRIAAEELGFRLISKKRVALESGKQFALLTFRS
jgi:SAM-dependent methyltransferase